MLPTDGERGALAVGVGERDPDDRRPGGQSQDLLQRVDDSEQQLVSTTTQIEDTTEEYARINAESLAEIKSLEKKL